MTIEALTASAFRIPTEEPESDGTLRHGLRIRREESRSHEVFSAEKRA